MFKSLDSGKTFILKQCVEFNLYFFLTFLSNNVLSQRVFSWEESFLLKDSNNCSLLPLFLNKTSLSVLVNKLFIFFKISPAIQYFFAICCHNICFLLNILWHRLCFSNNANILLCYNFMCKFFQYKVQEERRWIKLANNHGNKKQTGRLIV